MGCETSADRFNACKSMLDFGFANFALISAEAEGKMEVEVKLGEDRTVTAVPGALTRMIIDKAQRGSVATEVKLEESVTAPVSRGQRLGTLTVKAGEQVLAQVPLVAEQAVRRLGWSELFIMILRQVAMAQ